MREIGFSFAERTLLASFFLSTSPKSKRQTIGTYRLIGPETTAETIKGRSFFLNCNPLWRATEMSGVVLALCGRTGRHGNLFCISERQQSFGLFIPQMQLGRFDAFADCQAIGIGQFAMLAQHLWQPIKGNAAV